MSPFFRRLKVVFSSGVESKSSSMPLGVIYLPLNDYMAEPEWDINVQQVGLNVRHAGKCRAFSLPASPLDG